MKFTFSKFEKSIFLCLLISYCFLISGNYLHSFFMLGCLIVLCLLGIMAYLRLGL